MVDLQVNLQIQVDAERVTLEGDLSYKTVAEALTKVIFASEAPINKSVSIDFAGVDHADSSGLALMVHWLREAKKRNMFIQFVNIPKKLIALAEMSNLEDVLPIS